MVPDQKPGRSTQDYATPDAFIEAVKKRLGPVAADLAAHEGNAKHEVWLGPGSKFQLMGNTWEDALAENVLWETLWKPGSFLWLNPPYADIAPWATKALKTGLTGACVAMLTPASVGSNWFRDYVYKQAHVCFLQPRLSFVGTTGPYPKDLMLVVHNPPRRRGELPHLFEVWNWKTGQSW